MEASDREQENPYLGTALRAAYAAGEVLRRGFGRVERVDFKVADIDPVTEVDLASQSAALTLIHDVFPTHRLVAEEGAGDPVPWAEGPAWIVDPLDGTLNFVHGLPFFCVSVAYYEDGEPIAGVVYDPLREQVFSALRGQGAFLGTTRIAASREARLRRSVLATGTAAARQNEWPSLVRDMDRVAGAAASVRFLGSAALHLCYVACGRLDGFWERRLSPWDTAAGALLVREAGGSVTDALGQAYRPDAPVVVATNGLIHAEVLRLLT